MPCRIFALTTKWFPCWNDLGCGHPHFLTVFRQYLCDFKPNLVTILEPLISGGRANAFIAATGFDRSHCIEAVGFSGGIWLCWRRKIHVDILLNHFQFIHCRISITCGKFSTLATIIYASPNATKRKQLWPHLRSLVGNITSPWIMFGDFNPTFTASDRMNATISTRPCKHFQDFVYDFSIRDMGF
ncbi:uncharacterized protein LOC120158440 [Hibiscus syriacus]|uniref:uncharacterized protein LOC120158440 n=1 Tax=Hibiscus syriacus TaxID=106335 RepID=UPI0019237D9A|nr:uncharacterized protein LOC120158440 [Hibiscus syriacus]